ncbi:MAG: hypothetical protein WCY26_07750 [Thiohalobacteraceae bacterium]|nr:hypothetical protein [Gammaproteobacteria bacterium]
MPSIEPVTHTPPEYKLIRVEKAEPPAGVNGGSWYRYVVTRKNAEIVGNRCGSLQQVRRYAQEFTDALNTRAIALGHSVWARPHRKN